MSAVAAAAIVSGGLGVYKAIDGANQKSAANRLAKSNVFQPEQMPSEIQQATNLAQQNYTNGMPGQALAKSNIDQNGATAYYNGTQAASSGGDLLDLANKIGTSQNNATNNLAQQAAAYKSSALGGYENALGTQGQWDDKLYNNNVLQPYLRTANTAASMYGAGATNEFNGLDQIGLAGLGYANSLANQPDKPSVAASTAPGITANSTNSPYVVPPSTQTQTNPFQIPNLALYMAGSNFRKGNY